MQAVLAARLDALEPFERRVVQQAAVVGRTFWEASLVPLAEAEGRELGRALTALQEKDILAPGAEGRLAGERELAFKHVLIRDVAYGMLPKAVRSRKHFEVGAFIEERAGDRTDEVVALLAEHYGRAASLGPRGRAGGGRARPMRERAVRFLEEAGDAAALLYSNREAGEPLPPRPRAWGRDGDRAVLVRVAEKLGDVSLRLGRVDEAIEVWQECLDWHRGQEDLERVADLHRKIGAALSHKGERKAAIEHYQRGINLLKDGPPRLELVRLYEEAAWLYLHTGDNMLAIYASEKALRLAERLGETRAASRAHGIFGRVFGRIGDTAKARQNLERAVELARGSDDGESDPGALCARAPPRDLGGRRGRRARGLPRGAGAGRAGRRCCPRRWSCTPGSPSCPPTAPTGTTWSAPPRPAPSSPSARAWWASSASPTRCAGSCAGARGELEEATVLFQQAHELAEQVGWSEIAFQALFGLALALRDSRRLRQRRRHARPGDRRLRARRPARPVDPGHRRPRRGAVALPAPEAAREAAREAAELAERMHYPIGRAAALEARGLSAEDPRRGSALLADAETHLAGARPPARGRPLPAAWPASAS